MAKRTHSLPARIARTKAASGTVHRRLKQWQAMRILRRFTVSDLLAVTEQTNKHSLLTYLGQLRRAGFVRAHYGNRGRHEPTQFQLIRDSGPKPPALLKKGSVIYDLNTDTEYPLHD